MSLSWVSLSWVSALLLLVCALLISASRAHDERCAHEARRLSASPPSTSLTTRALKAQLPPPHPQETLNEWARRAQLTFVSARCDWWGEAGALTLRTSSGVTLEELWVSASSARP